MASEEVKVEIELVTVGFLHLLGLFYFMKDDIVSFSDKIHVYGVQDGHVFLISFVSLLVQLFPYLHVLMLSFHPDVMGEKPELPMADKIVGYLHPGDTWRLHSLCISRDILSVPGLYAHCFFCTDGYTAFIPSFGGAIPRAGHSESFYPLFP